MNIYDKVKQVPENAKKPIIGGRLKGKTDINPMWRIKILSEVFGPCGFGWKYEIMNKQLEKVGEQIACFVSINLYVYLDEKWSEPIPGFGGNMFVVKEKAGLRINDECFKMSLTDALSVACKALGVGASVYWEADKTKYTMKQDEVKEDDKISIPEAQKLFIKADSNADIVRDCMKEFGYTGSTKDIYKKDYKKILDLVTDTTKKLKNILKA